MRIGLLVLLAVGQYSLDASAKSLRSWGVESQSKVEIKVSEENKIERSRVTIRRNRSQQGAKPLLRRESISFEKALRYKRFEKTEQLIKQLEKLIPRTGQRSRRGELQMRLAELYFERAKDVASEESEDWKKAVEDWEKLSPKKREKSKRPMLRTPEADKYRRQALSLYKDLEKRSRGKDRGRSQSIQRDEVLFYLGMTLVDLRRGKSAVKPLEELLGKYPRSPRTFAARLQLADLYFDRGSFKSSRNLYIKLAGDRKLPKLSKELRPYIFYKLAWSYFNTGDYKKAVLAYKKTVDLADGSSTISFKQEAQRDLARTFALAGQYEEGVSYFKGRDEDLMFTHLANSADLASSRGKYDLAIKYYSRLIEDDPKSQVAHDYALRRMELYKRNPKKYKYFSKFKEYVEDFGADSSWMDKRSDEEQKIFTEEIVSLIRRDAKALHRSGQRRNNSAQLNAAALYYELYFDKVPSPNPDTEANRHEMQFYYAELLYKLKRYAPAAKAYSKVGKGKYSPNAAYARILALREVSAKNRSKSGELIDATEDFIEKFPEDKRGSDLLYASAFESYSSGEKKLSKKTLLSIMQKYPESSAGLKAAERYLFLMEEEGDLEAALEGTKTLLENKKLMKSHGNNLSRRLTLFREKVQFKKIEQMDDDSRGDKSDKAVAFLALAPKLSRSLQEKAYNNALVLSEKSGDKKLTKQAGDALLRKFPKSGYSRGLYLVQAEEFARDAKWSAALTAYQKYISLNKRKKALAKEEYEKALWNKIFIQAHLEGQIGVEVRRSKVATKALKSSITEFLGSYPRSQFRDAVIEIQAFRNGVTSKEITSMRSMPGLSSAERIMLDHAALAKTIRSTSRKGRGAVLRKWPSSKVKSLPWAIRRKLAQWSYESLEATYASFKKYKLKFKGKSFARTLKSKTSKLESLEKLYLSVVAYGDGDYALRSMSRLAEMYGNFAKELSKAPVPKADLAAFVQPFEMRTKDLLLDCIEKGKDFKIIGRGLDSCKNALKVKDPTMLTLTYEKIVNPGFIADPKTSNVLWQSARAAAKSRSRPKLLLSYKVAQGEVAAGKMDEDFLPYFDNVLALTLWTDGRTEEAVSTLRKTADLSGGDLKELRRSASMNLSSIFVQTGDYESAQSLMEGLESKSAQSAFIAGSAHVGASEFSRAGKIYKKAYDKFKDGDFLFHQALALQKNGDTKSAIRALKKFIDVEAPAASHVSRKLLKGWR